MHIYVSLLKQMAPEHLLQTFVKLCTEILAAVSDGMLNIDDITGQSVLQVICLMMLTTPLLFLSVQYAELPSLK